MHRGRVIRYCTVNQRKYDRSKGQFRAGVFEDLGIESRESLLRPGTATLGVVIMHSTQNFNMWGA